MNLTITSKQVLFFVFLAYCFSVLMRYVSVYTMLGDSSIMWNDAFLILSADGYHYANGAKSIIEGVSYDQAPIHAPLSILTAFLVKVLPFSFENIIFYMSTYIASLIVIPVFYISKKITNNYIAFGAAILSSIMVSYYQRTISGYYDTDMLNIVLPMFTFWFLLEALDSKTRLYAFLAVVSTFIFGWWLPSNIALNLSIATIILLYTFLFERKSLFNYLLFLLVVGASLPLSIMLKVPLLLMIFIPLYFHEKLSKKTSFIIIGFIFSSLIVIGFSYYDVIFGEIIRKLNFYINKDVSLENGLNFIKASSFIHETAGGNYKEFATRLSGHYLLLPLAILSYIVMLFKHKIMFLFLPMWGFAFMAYGIPGYIPSAGLRFAFYGTPIVAISLMYFIFILTQLTQRVAPRYVVLNILLFLLFLTPNIEYILKFKTISHTKNYDIQVLHDMKEKVKKEDYIVAWWDDGYPIRYYSESRVVSDGGRLLGKIMYPISYVFIDSSQYIAARMAQMITYEASKNTGLNYFKMMMNTYGYKDESAFFHSLRNQKVKPKTTSFDTYVYISKEMIKLYIPMFKAYQTDLKTGKAKSLNTFFQMSDSSIFFENKNNIFIDKDTVYIKDKQLIYNTTSKQSIPLSRIILLDYDKNNKLDLQYSATQHKLGITLIHMPDQVVLLVSENAFRSPLIQLGVLENYDRRWFEAVKLSPVTKVYKVKK